MKTITTNWVFGLLVTAALAAGALGVERPVDRAVQIILGNEGLASLKFGGAELLKDGTFKLRDVQLSDLEGTTVPADLAGGKVQVDKAGGAVTRTYRWGTLRCVYTASGSKLKMDVTVTNRSDRVMTCALLQLLELKFPAAIKGFDEDVHKGNNVSGPTVVGIDYGSGVVVLVNEELAPPAYVGFARDLSKPKPRKTDSKQDQSKIRFDPDATYPVIAANARHDAFYNKWMEDPEIHRPIYPGRTEEFHLSLRFGPAGAKVADLGRDIYRKYARAYPPTLKWDDRRVIGALHLSSSAMGIPKNPRGWFMDRSLDVTTDQGRAKLKARLMAYADKSIQVLKGVDAQGMIVWDVEGQEFPHATSYLGDPRSLPPEMDAVADEFFKKFIDAGLRAGITIRPHRPVRPAYAEGVQQEQLAYPGWTLEQKIAYAKKRWGCTLFYVDSNCKFDPYGRYDDEGAYELMDVEVFKRAAAANPDVLLMPEQEDARYYAYTAPFNSFFHHRTTSTPKEVWRIYPGAFSAIYAPEGPIDEYHDALLEAVKHGDILIINAWFDSAANEKVKKIYEEAKAARQAVKAPAPAGLP